MCSIGLRFIATRVLGCTGSTRCTVVRYGVAPGSSRWGSPVGLPCGMLEGRGEEHLNPATPAKASHDPTSVEAMQGLGVRVLIPCKPVAQCEVPLFAGWLVLWRLLSVLCVAPHLPLAPSRWRLSWTLGSRILLELPVALWGR